MKGKPWPADDEKQLVEWAKFGIGPEVIVFSFDGKYTKEAVRQKMISLGLEKQIQQFQCCCSSNLKLPPELPSVEDVLKKLAAALEDLETPGLEHKDILRLRSVISGAKIYKEIFADYIDYRGLEAEVMEHRQKHEEQKRKKPPNLAPT